MANNKILQFSIDDGIVKRGRARQNSQCRLKTDDGQSSEAPQADGSSDNRPPSSNIVSLSLPGYLRRHYKRVLTEPVPKNLAELVEKLRQLEQTQSK